MGGEQGPKMRLSRRLGSLEGPGGSGHQKEVTWQVSILPSGYPAHTLVDVTRPLYHWVELHRSRSMRSTRASIRTGDGLGAAARPHSGSVLKEETKKAPPPPPTLNFHLSCVLLWLNKDPSGSPRTQREEMHSERAGGGPSKRSLPERRKEG